MSIASELNNYRNGLDDAYDAVNDMSGIIPQHKNMDNLDQAIRTIPQSSGPTPGDGTLTIQKNGSTVATFTADQSTNTTANITVNDGKAVYMDQDSNNPDHILLYNDFAMTDQITDIYNDVYLKILNGEHIVFIDKANGQGTPLGYPYTYMYYGSSSFPDDEAYITLYGVKYDRDTHQFHPNEFSTAILIVYTYQSPDYAVIMSGTEYQGKLTAGSNVTISNGTISATDTTYSDFTGATSSVAGASGLAPAPAAGDQGKVLTGAGTWTDLAGSYSTSEVATPYTWVDGSTIYKQTFKTDNVTQAQTVVTHGISNFGALVNAEGVMHTASQGYQPLNRVLPDLMSTWGWGLGDVQATTFTLFFGSGYTLSEITTWITLYYTKAASEGEGSGGASD